MRKSIATVSLSGTLEEKLAAAAQVGFDGIELFENDLIGCPLTPAQIGRRATEFGLRVELYQPFRDFEGVPDEVLRANLRRAGHKFEVMAQLGVDTILVCSTVFSAFATAMLVVLIQSGRHKEVVGMNALMVVGGWLVAYLALRMLMAIPKKKEDIW